MMKSKIVEDYLDELFPNPECELNFSNDYELLIAIVLSAQSTDKRVNSVTSILFDKYSSLEDIIEADISSLEDIIKPVGSFHRKALYIHNIASILVNNYNGKVPKSRDELMNMPGVGRKTANVFLSEFYKEPAIGVDTHVERVSKRLGLAKKNDDVLMIEKKLMKCFNRDVWAKRHLQMVLFGRYHCKAIKPNCEGCKLISICLFNNKKNIRNF